MRYAKKTLARLDALCAAACNNEAPRRHLGASTLGQPCHRRIWYGWRWAARETVGGSVARLFARGHREEAVFERYLTMLGAQVWTVDPDTGSQFRIAFADGHGGGSCDMVALGGCDEIPADEPYLVECKTHNTGSFEKLCDDGVMGSKYEHAVQAQVYMAGLGLSWCLYMAVNKNNDDLHLEVLQYDEDMAYKYIRTAELIVESPVPPHRIADKISNYACRYCPAKEVCHADVAPLRNCRTCKFAAPKEGGDWACARGMKQIGTSPEVGCSQYRRAF